MIVFEKFYDGESLYDIDRDVAESMQGEYNPLVLKIPSDEFGIQRGTFKVTIQWFSENEL